MPASILYYVTYFHLGALNLTASKSGLCPAVTFTCSAVNLDTVLRWFVNDDLFASYDLIPSDMYPLTVEPVNATYNALVGGADVQILAASLNEENQNFASFLSTMTVNISALQDAGVSHVSCGRISRLTRTYANISYNSSAGS